MERTFYRTVYTITIISERPADGYESLADLEAEFTNGGFSAEVEAGESEEITPKEAAEALMDQGSDPAFFELDERGRDLDSITEEEKEQVKWLTEHGYSYQGVDDLGENQVESWKKAGENVLLIITPTGVHISKGGMEHGK